MLSCTRSRGEAVLCCARAVQKKIAAAPIKATLRIRMLLFKMNLLLLVRPAIGQTYFAADIDGGAASCALPHRSFGVGPIVSTSFAPFSISEWLNHGLFHGLPFSVAD